MAPPATAAPPPKKGSAREGVLNDLRKRAKPEPGTVTPEPEPTKSAAPKENDSPVEGDESTAVPPDGKPSTDPKKKVNPWKLVDDYKAKIKAKEAELAELGKRAIPEDKWKSVNETLAQKESRLKELEEEIRYVNYSKSDEFKTKYQKPYDDAWKRAMSELGELTVETADGNSRPVEPKDILELVNMPLGQAHASAVEKFGELAPEVMAQRKEIRKLWDDQAAALEQSRTDGEAREKRTSEARQKEIGEMTTGLKDQWTKANESAAADPKYGTFFKPIDGDEQGNQRLAKGFELADRAFSENPLASGLTPEQRNAIVQRHAAVRNRCAAFGRLVYQNQTKDARVKELEAQLAEYNGTEPPADGVARTNSPAAPAKGMDGVLAELRKRAK